VGGHEIDQVRSHFGGGADEIALIFAIFIIDDDDHFAVPDVTNDVFNAAEFHRGGV